MNISWCAEQNPELFEHARARGTRATWELCRKTRTTTVVNLYKFGRPRSLTLVSYSKEVIKEQEI